MLNQDNSEMNTQLLETIQKMTAQQIVDEGLDVFYINDAIDELSAKIKKCKELVDQAMHLKYDEQAEHALRIDGRTHGRVHLACGIMAEKVKKVVWNQEIVSSIVDLLSPDERKRFVKTTYAIDERKYATWTEYFKGLFLPARTVEFGKIKYKLQESK